MNSVMLSAAVSGEGMVKQLVFVLVVGICLAVVYFLGRYFITSVFALPPTAMKVWNGLFALLGGLCIINFLLGLVDLAFIKW